MPGLNYQRVPLLRLQTVDETTSTPVNVLGYPTVGIYVTGAGTTSSGVVTIETADFNPSNESTYTGTWSAITTVNASDVTGGATKFIGLPVAGYSQIRTRISTVIGGGGTISTTLVAVSNG